MALFRRRRHPRAYRRSRAPVLARLKGESDDAFRRVEDIGRGGLRLMTDRRLKVDQWVPIQLQFPDLWEEVDVHAKVAWRRRSGETGFTVLELDPEDAGLLEVMIAHQEVLGSMALLC